MEILSYRDEVRCKTILKIVVDDDLEDIEEAKRLIAEDTREQLRKYWKIEEELGIPLEVLFKALKQGKIYTRASEYDKYSFHFIRGANMQSIHCISKVCPYPDCDFGVDLIDYGKTWWLEEPKEELENAKN